MSQAITSSHHDYYLYNNDWQLIRDGRTDGRTDISIIEQICKKWPDTVHASATHGMPIQHRACQYSLWHANTANYMPIQPTESQYSQIHPTACQYSPWHANTANGMPIQHMACQYSLGHANTSHGMPIHHKAGRYSPRHANRAHRMPIQPKSCQYSPRHANISPICLAVRTHDFRTHRITTARQ